MVITLQSGTGKKSEILPQVSLFTLMEEPLRAKLADFDVNLLSPMEALHALQKLVEEAGM